jgi:cytochrome c5
MGCLRLVSIALLSLLSTTLVMAGSHSNTDRPGATVFEENCANCHTGGFGGFFTGAPEVGDADDWEALIPKGIDGLTAVTLAGIGKMAARGECTTCTDAEIRAAIEYMVSQSQ